MDSSTKSLTSFDYQVFGKVQGVYFRKYTKEQADALGLKGWVMNTKEGTVVGTVQGPADKMKEMQNFKHIFKQKIDCLIQNERETWLSTKGSPSSKITKFEKKNLKTITAYAYTSFSIKK